MIKVQMKMPDLATNEGAEIAVLKWLVEPGQAVKRGEPLLEVETDKAVQEVECISNGTLLSIAVEAGESIGVGEVIAEIEAEGATPAPETESETPESPTEKLTSPETRKAAPERSGGMFARRRAEKEKE